MKPRLRTLLPVAATALVVAHLPLTPLSGQSVQKQPGATFRMEVNLVQVDVATFGREGQFVADLRPDDFEVLEDGKAQSIVSADLVTVPEAVHVSRPAAAETSVAVAHTNEQPFDGRVYLIVLDDLHIAPARTILARRIATAFIEKTLAPGDLAAVYLTSADKRGAQGFTTDASLLLRAANAFVGRKPLSPGAEALERAATPEVKVDSGVNERTLNALAAMQTLEALARFAAGIRNRRKAMVLVSEGVDVGLDRDVGDKLRDFTAQASRANLTLYAFDPRVYTHGLDEFIDIRSTKTDVIDPSKTESAYVKTFKIQDDLKTSQDNLRILATETGGFAVTGSAMALAQGFDRVRAENSTYYMLAYYSSNDARDGKFRRVAVRVKRPGVRVVARRGYAAPRGAAVAPALDAKEGTSAAVRDALASVLPVYGLPLQVTASALKGTTDDASVVVVTQLRGADLTFERQGDRFQGSAEVSAIAVPGFGQSRGGQQLEATMALSPENHERVRKEGLVFVFRMTLPAGRYQLRVAGRDGGSARVGSVTFDLDVPSFQAAPFSVSDILVTADEAGQVPNPRPDPELRARIETSPVATRTFDENDQVGLVGEVYDGAAQPHEIVISTAVQDESGRVLSRREQRRSSAEANARGALGFVSKIPLHGFPAGSYTATVEARSALAPEGPVTRTVTIQVR